MSRRLEDVRQDLVRYQLISSGELVEVERRLATMGRGGEAGVLIQGLVRAGRLTPYQASAVLRGQARGLTFGEYTVLDKIGEGGMGEVLKARHRTMDRIVALKVLPARAMKSPDAVRRFRREVRAAARLSHPNIVTAYDAGEHRGTHYLVMEFVDGPDLATLVKDRGPLPVEQAVDYAVQAARGLGYAHGQGIVHRDIKPGNLLLGPGGVVKILDMGLARINLPFADSGPASAEQITSSGQLLGTCDYMAPEQAEDTHTVDHRADIYSLGCTLYRLLTGNVLYKRENVVLTLVAHRDAEVPSLCEARPDVTRTLEAVFQKMVAKRPEDRYQTMAEVEGALEACLRPAAARAAEPAETSTEQALKNFLADLPPTPPPAPPRMRPPKARLEETVGRRAEQDTDPSGEPSSWVAGGRRKWVLAGIAGGVGLLAAAVVVVVLAVGGRDWPKSDAGPQPGLAGGNQQPAAAGPEQAGASGPEEPSEGFLVLDWPQSERKGAVLEVDGHPHNVTGRVDPAAPRRLRIPVGEGTHTVWIARDGFQHFTEEVEVEAGQEAVVRPVWKSLAVLSVGSEPAGPSSPSGEVGGAGSQPGPAAAPPLGFADSEPPGQTPVEPGPSPQPPEPAGEGTPADTGPGSPVPPETILAGQRDLEARYATALAEVTQRAAAWDFQAAADALDRVRFNEPQLAARLPALRNQLAQMTQLKARIIRRINAADPPLKKSDLQIRGLNGEITGADEQGISAKLLSGKTETVRWAELGEKAVANLLQLVVDPDTAQDWLGASMLASTAGYRALAERLVAQARSQGADTDPHLALLAAADLAHVLTLAGQGQIQEARLALDALEKAYGGTPWFRSHQEVLEALRRQLAPSAPETPGGGPTVPVEQPAPVAFTATLRTTLKGHSQPVVGIAFSGEGNILVSCDDDEVWVWNARGEPTRFVSTRDHGCCVALAPNGSTLAVGHLEAEKGVDLFHVPSGKALPKLRGHGGGVFSIAFSPDSRVIATASSDMTIGLWLASGQVRRLKGHTGSVTSVAFSPTGRKVASASHDQTVRVWDVASGREIFKLEGHTARVHAVAFSSDGRLLASGGEDKTVRLWDVGKGQLVQVLQGQPDPVVSVAFAPHGRAVGASNRNRPLIIFWDPATGQELTRLTDFGEGGAGCLTFSPDGTTLAAVNRLNIPLWDVTVPRQDPAAENE